MSDSFIFSGNRQESVPRALFLDQRLTPLERNAWQIIRMMLESDGITALPTYEQLRPYLTSMPYAEKASFETIAKALTILRLTRWLSLARKRRAKDGSKQSNLYVLHDEPLTPFEAFRLDDDYLALVYQSISHASKAIQLVAQGVLQDIADDPYLAGKKLPTRLEILLGRVADKEQAEKLSTTHESEVSTTDLLRNQESLTSESEAGINALQHNSIRNPKQAVCSSSNINILLQGLDKNLVIPERFQKLRAAQQKGILTAVQQVSLEVQQKIFDEWEKRCCYQSVRNPAAYLYGIIQKAYRGEFNELVDEQKPMPPQAVPRRSEPVVAQKKYIPPTAEGRKAILQQLQEMKRQIKMKGR